MCQSAQCMLGKAPTQLCSEQDKQVDNRWIEEEIIKDCCGFNTVEMS